MKFSLKALLAASAILLIAPSANAAVIISITQVGENVQFVGAGSIDTTGFNISVPTFTSRRIQPQVNFFRTGVGDTLNAEYHYDAFSSGSKLAQTRTRYPVIGEPESMGDDFGISYNFVGTNNIFLPLNYVSGTQLSFTTLFRNTTIDGMALNPAGAVFTLRNGDTVTFNITATAAVPEASTWAMMTLGFGAMGFAMRRKKVSTRIRFA